MFKFGKLSKFDKSSLVLRLWTGAGGAWYMNTDSSAEVPEVMATVDDQSPVFGLLGEKNV